MTQTVQLRLSTLILCGLGVLPILLTAAAPTTTPPGRRIAVTMDDLPVVARGTTDITTWRAITTGVLDAFGHHHVPAVGFVNANKLMVDDSPAPERVDLLRRWLAAGLELGNHTFSHPSLNRTPLKEFEADVIRGESPLREILARAGRSLRFFRHPYLHTGRDLKTRAEFEAFLTARGYRVAPVTVDNGEWIFAFAYDRALEAGNRQLAKRIAGEYIPYMEAKTAYFENQSRKLFGREIAQILLIHANRLNSRYLDPLLAMLKHRGYTFIPLDAALNDSAYRSADTYTGAGGISWLHRWALTRGEKGAFFAGEPTVPAFVLQAAGVESE